MLIQFRFIECAQSAARIFSHQQLDPFDVNSLNGDFFQQSRIFFKSLKCLFFNFEIELTRETNRTHHSQSIFVESLMRITDSFQTLVLQVAQAVKHVNDSACFIHCERIDRQITPL